LAHLKVSTTILKTLWMEWALRMISKLETKFKHLRRSLRLLKIEILWHFLNGLRKRLRTKRKNV